LKGKRREEKRGGGDGGVGSNEVVDHGYGECGHETRLEGGHEQKCG